MVRSLDALRRRVILVGSESDVAGIPTDNQDFACAAQILCEKPALRLCLEQGFKAWKIAFVNRAVVVAGIQKDLELTFRHFPARLEPHQGVPDLPARNALTIPVVPVAGVRLMVHRLPPGVYVYVFDLS